MSCQRLIPSSLVGILLAGCGSSAFTPDIDAEPPLDACTCQAPSLSERLGLVDFSVDFIGNSGPGSGCVDWDDGTVIGDLLGGSAVAEGPSEENASLLWLGPFYCSVLPSETCTGGSALGWFGMWQLDVPDYDGQITTTAACALFSEGECERDFFVWHSFELDTLPAQGFLDLGATCERGKLIGGGCSIHPMQDRSIAALRAGFDPQDPDRWLCSWESEQLDDADAMAFAFCLEETIPEGCGCCSSLEESLIVRTERRPLRYGANRLQVGCEDGETLLLGNCMLEGDSAALADFRMFRYGFPPGDRTQWECSWRNPSAATSPYATASALCLTE